MSARFDPQQMSPGQIYDLLANLIVPRPIAFVSTMSNAGARNVAPFSYFMLGGIAPPSLCFSPVRGRNGERKETLVNIEETREFVVNLVDRNMVEGMNVAAGEYPGEVDKWELSGFTEVESERVRPARVLESPASFECRLHQIVSHGDGPGSTAYVIGEVLLAHVRPDLVSAAQGAGGFLPVARLGGQDYFDLAACGTFSLQCPPAVMPPQTYEAVDNSDE
ncbi:MAG: flavin reductase family protein [Fimbriimonadaceae bacterium]|nr:flavin reductase family protein [Fimbriimonadaceae bacterium]